MDPLIDIPEFVDKYFYERRAGRCRLLVLTYEFNPGTFETRFERVLRRQNVQVDVVIGQPPARDQNLINRPQQGLLYRVWRANWLGKFHPKIIILMADDDLVVGLGSANMTVGGLGGNLECWQFYPVSPDNSSVVGGVKKLLECLIERKIVTDKAGLKEITSALPSEVNTCLIHTLTGRLFDQVIPRLRGPVLRVDIISPINGDPGRLLELLRRKTGAKEIHYYSHNNPMPSLAACTSYWRLEPPGGKLDDEEKLAKYTAVHSKMFAFCSVKGIDLFWGSANASNTAWLNTGSGSNIDFLIHSRLSHGEWEKFRTNLPNKYSWKKVRPKGECGSVEEECTSGNNWRFLHACWDGRALQIEAGRSGEVALRLKSTESREVRHSCVFQENQCVCSQSMANRLGFRPGNIPSVLQVATGTTSNWQIVPVNSLLGPKGDDNSADVAHQLYWQYAGRPFSGQRVVSITGDPDSMNQSDPLSKDEEELTESPYQGEFDRFVLLWRTIAYRLNKSAPQGSDLLRERIEDALCRIQLEALHQPGRWPRPKQDFVKSIFNEIDGAANV